jgi:hypothetical protein
VVRTGLVAAIVCGTAWRPGIASGPDETVPSTPVLMEMEQHADHADVREKCFLYTQLLHSLTELEGKEIGAGNDETATATLAQINRVAGKLKSVESRDSKRLKNAEALMDHTTHRMGDMMHLANGQTRVAMKATLDKLNGMHEEILALVFAR